MTARNRGVVAVLLSLVGLATGACGGSSTTSPSTTTATASTELFTGNLSPAGTAFYSFTVTTAGSVAVTLASLSSSTIGPAVPVTLKVGVGVPSGFGCATASDVDTSPRLTAQLTVSGAKDNIYCVNLSDSGALSGDALFVIRIVHT